MVSTHWREKWRLTWPSIFVFVLQQFKSQQTTTTDRLPSYIAASFSGQMSEASQFPDLRLCSFKTKSHQSYRPTYTASQLLLPTPESLSSCYIKQTWCWVHVEEHEEHEQLEETESNRANAAEWFLVIVSLSWRDAAQFWFICELVAWRETCEGHYILISPAQLKISDWNKNWSNTLFFIHT